MNGPRTKAGLALLKQEAYNSRSFALITAEAIVAIEREATARERGRIHGQVVDILWESDRDAEIVLNIIEAD